MGKLHMGLLKMPNTAALDDFCHKKSLLKLRDFINCVGTVMDTIASPICLIEVQNLSDYIWVIKLDLI